MKKAFPVIVACFSLLDAIHLKNPFYFYLGLTGVSVVEFTTAMEKELSGAQLKTVFTCSQLYSVVS